MHFVELTEAFPCNANFNELYECQNPKYANYMPGSNGNCGNNAATPGVLNRYINTGIFQ